jgi:hypothetical protein
VRGLDQDGFSGLRCAQSVEEPDVAVGRVEDATGAGLAVQDPDHQVAARAEIVDQGVDVDYEVGIGAGPPDLPLAEGLLGVDDEQCAVHVPIVVAWRVVTVGRIESLGGRIRSRPGGPVHRRRHLCSD